MEQVRVILAENKELRIWVQSAAIDRDELSGKLRVVSSENARLKQETDRGTTKLLDFQTRMSALNDENFNLLELDAGFQTELFFAD
ncbi:MAG: hypothetical protein AAGK05_15620 [Pseudomonadota bacterium]